ELRGYLGISLFGRSQTWRRLPDNAMGTNTSAPSRRQPETRLNPHNRAKGEPRSMRLASSPYGVVGLVKHRSLHAARKHPTKSGPLDIRANEQFVFPQFLLYSENQVRGPHESQSLPPSARYNIV